MLSDTQKSALSSVRRATILAVVAAFAFGLFFQLSKLNVIESVSPFADDPYDAVGSIDVQVALAMSVLSLARLVQQLKSDTPTRDKLRFILRGNFIVALAVGITMLTDVIAIIQNPTPLSTSYWGIVLIAGVIILGLLVVLNLFAQWQADRKLSAVYQGFPKSSTFRTGMLSEALVDVLTLLWLPFGWVVAKIPVLDTEVRRLWAFYQRSFLKILVEDSWISPRLHPWRFVFLAAFGAGAFLLSIHFLDEGFAPSIDATLLITLIFFAVEFAAVGIGFTIFGAYLGLRFPLVSRGHNLD